MPAGNLPPQGTLYIKNFGGTRWSQPNGPNTTVFPQQQVNQPFLAYPTSGQIWAENSGLWVCGCGHWQNCITIFRDYDNVQQISVAVIACSLCSFIQRYQSPYESITDPMRFPVIIP